MRILMLSWEYPPHVVGGLGVHVGALVPALVRAGVDVHVVTPRWAGGAEREPLVAAGMPGDRRGQSNDGQGSGVLRVIPPVTTMGNFFADAQQTNLHLEEQAHALFQDNSGFDVVHAHDWLVAFAATALKRIHKVPLVATIHATERGRARGRLGGETPQAINGAEWWLTYEAWRVITASRYMADEVERFFQVPADKVDIVPNGVDTQPFDALEGVDLREFRSRWASPDQQIVFSVGRMVSEKGAHLIVEAAPNILAEIPQARFVIAGTGGTVDSLRQRVRELGVAHAVNVAGFISDEDRNRLLKVADAAVFPSLYEPFGIVALEAMAARCPVVAASVGGLAEVVQHDKTGITVYPDDVGSLAWGIRQTLRDPAAAARRVEAAYKMVKVEYSWDHIAAQTIRVYERVALERSRTTW